MVSKWLHIAMEANDTWVLPVWKAIHQAESHGKNTQVGGDAKQLALHLSTRLNMIPIIVERLNKDYEKLLQEIISRKNYHEWTTDQNGKVFRLSHRLQYDILIDLDSLIFELNGCCELIKVFCSNVSIYRKVHCN